MAGFDVMSVLDTGGVAYEVNAITGRMSDAAAAAGVSAWISAVTGSPMLVERMENNRARVYMDETQIDTMRQWLDETITGKRESDSRVQIELSPAFQPVVLKYAIPAIAGAALLGFLAGKLT